MIARLARELGAESGRIDPTAPLGHFGIDSIRVMQLTHSVETWLGRRLPATFLYDHPNLRSVAVSLAGCGPDLRLNGHGAPTFGASAGGADREETIAVVGMACRVAGADGLTGLWDLLKRGRCSVTEVPKDRWPADAFYDPRPLAPGKMTTRWGGFLSGVDRFDPLFFGISPREAVQMDPQQRLLLESTWHALEDAGMTANGRMVTDTGVFVGLSNNDYPRLFRPDFTDIDGYTGTGNAHNIAANRISYALDFHGPSMVVDTACSSSLVAVHQARRSLMAGECSVAIAGGANVILSPAATIGFSKSGVMSPDGACRAFDARANGFVRGEGAGVVVLKRLSHARRDGDRIYAVIRGSAVTTNGRTTGILAPSFDAQAALLRAACKNAGIDPLEVQYVEAHGTGTVVGDAIEARAIGAAYGRAEGGLPCLIGSIKTNIGHLEAAAGILGFIKVALCVYHREIPASLHFEQGSPEIPFESLSLRVVSSRTSWPEGRRATAGVSSFGFGGANAHAILAEAPAPIGPGPRSVADAQSSPHVLVIAAASRTALMALADAYSTRLEGADEDLAAVVRTAATRRKHHPHRLAVVGSSCEEMREGIAAFLRGDSRAGVESGVVAPSSGGVLLVFPGQGPKWRPVRIDSLIRHPAARDALSRCTEAFRPYLDGDLADVLESSSDENLVHAQAAMFALQVVVAEQWLGWGLAPCGVLGHSLGEVAAAHVAGALSLEDAARVVVERARGVSTAGPGAMLDTELSEEVATAMLRDIGTCATVAAVNGPRSTVLAGTVDELSRIAERLDARQIYNRRLNVTYAGHSPHMDTVLPSRRETLGTVRGRPARVPLWSTVTGARIDEPLDGGYWVKNLRMPVRSLDATRRALEAGADIVVEISPHPVLRIAVKGIAEAAAKEVTAIHSLERGVDPSRALLSGAAAAFARGLELAWDRICAEAPMADLPLYPFDRGRYWIRAPGEYQCPPATAQRAHPLLGHRVASR